YLVFVANVDLLEGIALVLIDFGEGVEVASVGELIDVNNAVLCVILPSNSGHWITPLSSPRMHQD
ncbi:MAG: hypothetical protein R6V52_02740, partial [Bacteroidales bacterium]